MCPDPRARWSGPIALCALLAFVFVTCKPTDPSAPVLPRPLAIGTLALVAGDATGASPMGRIELPDIKVFLQDGNNQRVATGVTQLDGKFRLPIPAPGSYTVCWDAPHIGAGCGAKFNAQTASVFLDVVPVRANPGILVGTALTGDNRPCWVNDPFFGLDVTTAMTLFDATSQVVFSGTRANAFGEYAFAGLKAGRYRVRAECEKASAEGTASLRTVAVANLSLGNRAPRIAAMSAFDGTRGLTRAAAGAKIRVDALVREADLDPVEYLWKTGDGTIAGSNAAQQDWTLTARPGLHSLYLVARDGKGGYSFKRFDIQVGATNVTFSGRVIEEGTQNVVANAKVTVNGASNPAAAVSGSTNAQGWFSLSLPPEPSPERYVLNVRHPQYTLLSRIHDKESTGNTYELIRSQTTTHDPSQPIDVVDRGSGGPCGGKDTKPAQPLRPSAKSQRYQPEPCRHRGARLVLPAGALVDSSGNLAAGPVSLSFATLNPARRAIPGDYRALDRSNNPAEMLSFGAIHAEFRDSSGNPVNLRAGTTAEVRVPVSDLQRPVAAPTIAMWSYDEGRGLWIEEGTAQLKSTADGWMYIGTTTHFSEINMDVAGNDPAQATCVRLELGNSLAGWANLVLRAYVSYAGTSVQVKETALDGAQYHAIFRIPYAPPAPPPNTLRLELRGTYNGVQVVLLDDIIATDAPRPKMTGNNLWPDPPYTECGDPIVLEADPVNLPYYGDIDATGRPAFLTGPYGNFLPENGEQVATDYYNTIDPGNALPTLASWWTGHGFNADGTGGTRASYLNHNDLGFGRDMNCRVNGSDLACYVTNYGLPDQNPDNANAAEGQVLAKRGATVAMEYKASEPADRRVRFFVYAGGDPATAGKLKFADLDGLGPKPVPHLCIVCHGGQYDDVAKNAIHARFREFDLPSFKYSGGRSWDFAPAPNTLTPNELTAFASLNKMVRDIAPASSRIDDLIDAWYTGGFGAGTAPVKPTPPSGWSGQVNGYHNVYGQSCRTCHIARDDGDPNSYFLFNTSANFATTEGVVCGSPKVMPNAFVTYKNFWSNLQRVIDYKALTGAATCQ